MLDRRRPRRAEDGAPEMEWMDDPDRIRAGCMPRIGCSISVLALATITAWLTRRTARRWRVRS